MQLTDALERKLNGIQSGRIRDRIDELKHPSQKIGMSVSVFVRAGGHHELQAAFKHSNEGDRLCFYQEDVATLQDPSVARLQALAESDLVEKICGGGKLKELRTSTSFVASSRRTARSMQL